MHVISSAIVLILWLTSIFLPLHMAGNDPKYRNRRQENSKSQEFKSTNFFK